MASFKKKPVDPKRVIAAEIAAAQAPIVESSRSLSEATDNLKDKLGSEPSSVTDPAVYVVGQVYDVPLHLIQSNPFNPRVIYTASAIDAMAQSLSKKGQLAAISGYLSGENKITLIEGETRLRAARAAGFSTLRIEIRPKPANDRQLYEEARAANIERNNQTLLDDAFKWKELTDKNIYSQAELARVLEISEDKMSRILSLTRLPNAIIYRMVENQALCTLKMLTAVREYFEASSLDETLNLLEQVEKEGLGYREVTKLRKIKKEGKVRRPRSVKEEVHFMGIKGDLKLFEDKGRFELSFSNLERDISTILIREVKSFLEKA